MGTASDATPGPQSAFGLQELALCFRLHASLARASVLFRVDRERAGWFLAVAQAALEAPDPSLPLDVRLELRRLVSSASASLQTDDVPHAESSVALAEGLCVATMLRRAASSDGSSAGFEAAGGERSRSDLGREEERR